MKKNNLLVFVLIALVFLTACTKEVNEDSKPETPEAPQHFKIKYKLLDKEYTLPTSYEELEKDGWILQDDPETVLEKETFIRNKFLRNGPYILDVSFYNPKDEDQKLSESLISSIGAENRSFGNDKASDLLVMDKVNFSSSIEDASKVLGEYSEESNAQFDTYIFQHDKLSKTEIKIDKDNNTTRWIIIESFRAD